MEKPKKPTINAIAAVQRSKNENLDLLIGSGDTELLYKIREDLDHFYEKTEGNILIIGGKTLRSMRKYGVSFEKHWPETLVITRDLKQEKLEGVTFTDANHALSQAVSLAEKLGKDVFVAGGSEIYAMLMPYVERLHITEIQGEKIGDKKFPSWHSSFTEVDRKQIETKSGVIISFVTLERE